MASALVSMLAHVAAHQPGFEAWDIHVSDLRESMVRLVFWGVTGPKVPRVICGSGDGPGGARRSRPVNGPAGPDAQGPASGATGYRPTAVR